MFLYITLESRVPEWAISGGGYKMHFSTYCFRQNNFGIKQKKASKKGNKKIQHKAMFYPQFLIFENHIQFLTSHTESHENDPSRKMYHPSKNGKCTTHKFK